MLQMTFIGNRFEVFLFLFLCIISKRKNGDKYLIVNKIGIAFFSET